MASRYGPTKCRKNCFKQLLADINLWGSTYIVAMRRFVPANYMFRSSPENYGLFPQEGKSAAAPEPLDVEVMPAVMTQKVLEICSRLGCNKTPGLHDLPNKVHRVTVKSRTDIFLELFEASLIFFLKYGNPQAYYCGVKLANLLVNHPSTDSYYTHTQLWEKRWSE